MMMKCDVAGEHHHGMVIRHGDGHLCTYHRIKYKIAAAVTKMRFKEKHKKCKQCMELFS